MRAAGLAVRYIPEESGVELGSSWGASPHKLSSWLSNNKILEKEKASKSNFPQTTNV